MNELLGRVVRLTEPLERAQRGAEYVGENLKRAIFGPEEAARASIDAEVIAEERAVVEELLVVEEAETPAESPEAPAEDEAPAQPPDPSAER